jgi:pyruvate dehydrogenase E1 component alpha subunit/2-oxoisovalerate dehydrogenase E1 component alpha subunit
MLEKIQLLELYYWLQLNRAVEERLTILYRTGKVVGGLYSSRGQEGISVGAAYALDEADYLAPMIRNLGAVLVRGFTPADVFTQYMARSTSPSGGRDCNIHIGKLARGLIPPVSILGALIPVMAGVALAAKMQRKKIVALTFIGDGGTSTGDFHEGLNFAAVHKLPLVVVIEDNGWAYSTPTDKQAANPDFLSRGPAYGIRAFSVDGNDVVAVYETAREAIAHARRGDGPAIIIAKTMRMKGHAEHDDAWYVPKEGLELWKTRDPIHRFERHLEQSGFMSAEERDMILSRIRSEVDSATEFAETSPLPDSGAAAGGVYG